MVDAAAMVEGLRSGKVRFYATDVMEAEPPTADDPLLRLDNVIVSSHIGAETIDASCNMLAMALNNAMDVLEGKECRNIVNK